MCSCWETACWKQDLPGVLEYRRESTVNWGLGPGRSGFTFSVSAQDLFFRRSFIVLPTLHVSSFTHEDDKLPVQVTRQHIGEKAHNYFSSFLSDFLMSFSTCHVLFRITVYFSWFLLVYKNKPRSLDFFFFFLFKPFCVQTYFQPADTGIFSWYIILCTLNCVMISPA